MVRNKEGFILLLGALGILFLVIYGSHCAYYEIRFHMQNKFECPAKLISAGYTESTFRTHVAPVIGGGKIRTAIYTTGNPESHTTIWYCKEYGNLISNDEFVFRLSKPEAILYLKKYGNDVRIVGIKEKS